MNESIKASALRTLEMEANEILNQKKYIDENFVEAISLIFNSRGKVVISGMGKSGIIGKKFSASLSSTGTPSFYIHPGEAFHGDLGMVEAEDIVVLISNSGETDEILKLIPYFHQYGNVVVSITSNENSTLAVNSTCHVKSSVELEACPLNLAPTSSTTSVLALTDAFVVSLMSIRDFKPENFARFHPGGSLGRRLLGRVSDIMRNEPVSVVQCGAGIVEVVSAISNSIYGVAVVKDQNDKVHSIITDGDLRRAMEVNPDIFFSLIAEDVSKVNPKTILINDTISKAEGAFKKEGVNTLIVMGENGELRGILGLKDVVGSI